MGNGRLAAYARAGGVGVWIANQLGPNLPGWVIGVSFLAMAVWMLVSDKMDEQAVTPVQRSGVFGTTVLTFFAAEMGDKTQIATVALSVCYHDLWAVVACNTLGMMLARDPLESKKLR